jgi:pyridoxine 5-phosphate synthase
LSICLSVNLNKIALLRNSREGNFPNVLEFGKLALEAGADGLTVHPRPDQRHIRANDIDALAELCRSKGKEFNIEGNPFAAARGDYPGLIELAKRAQPDQCTLVPDGDDQLTSDHGFDIDKDATQLAPLIDTLKQAGVRVSLFMDPKPEQYSRIVEIGADRIELYTGPYAQAFAQSATDGQQSFAEHAGAAREASALGLGVNAGHDLNLDNLPLYSTLPGLLEVSIGHALTVDALLHGFEYCIKKYKQICSKG